MSKIGDVLTFTIKLDMWYLMCPWHMVIVFSQMFSSNRG